MATVQKITLPANTATLIIIGDGRRVAIQGGQFFIGGSNVDLDNGMFISGGRDFVDLGNVALGETIYAFSDSENFITIFRYTTTL